MIISVFWVRHAGENKMLRKEEIIIWKQATLLKRGRGLQELRLWTVILLPLETLLSTHQAPKFMVWCFLQHLNIAEAIFLCNHMNGEHLDVFVKLLSMSCKMLFDDWFSKTQTCINNTSKMNSTLSRINSSYMRGIKLLFD